jgi:hypothetical protein
MAEVKTLEQLQKVIAGTRFEADLKTFMKVNNGQMSHGVWNLIISKRDCSLYNKGIKPNRFWKISDVKTYFGITGSAEKMAETLTNYLEILKPSE